MNPEEAKEGIEHLEHIENELEQIKQRTGGTYRSFVNGLFQGGGAVVGGVIALVLLGLLLSFLGLIPGLNTVAAYLHDAATQLHYSR